MPGAPSFITQTRGAVQHLLRPSRPPFLHMEQTSHRRRDPEARTHRSQIWARPTQIPHRDLVRPLARFYDKVEFTDLVAEQKARAQGNHNRRNVGAPHEEGQGMSLDSLPSSHLQHCHSKGLRIRQSEEINLRLSSTSRTGAEKEVLRSAAGASARA
ncbi:hypothetical protein Q7C36_011267 [Tachysurus vachellii]|uniref:Uncharacterized protein n=1 Tax=Tachysurus vachellii TaxID=175792 RepID=A0AA88MV48_TACVA|nr:hypothetical protein Q7C36_011267 [Tachysurus vachellii]